MLRRNTPKTGGDARFFSPRPGPAMQNASDRARKFPHGIKKIKKFNYYNL
jgi:hypothetical protein